MGSTRLPGKVLMDIAGRPMLWHIINRLKYSKLINKIVVATTTEIKDDPVDELCRENHVCCYRGSENDVLDRYYQAAKIYGAEIIVRITADCPLIDPVVTDKVIDAYLKNKSNFDGANNTIDRTFPRGLDTEVIKFSVLKFAWEKATKDYEREHVTIFIDEHPELFKLFTVKNKKNLSNLRWTVDEEADLEFVREIYLRLYKKREVFLMEDILKVLAKEPRLIEINKDIKQKTI
jgi:spore coat polysaccharide biosynthesis protein SpsF